VTASGPFRVVNYDCRDLIGHASEDNEVNCGSCLKAFERARRIYSDLSARLGVS
jgi:hypothetical protein